VLSAHLLIDAETLYAFDLHPIDFGGTEPDLSVSRSKQSRQQ
jgi:hypothetical protein